jgi:hypothetical protein
LVIVSLTKRTVTAPQLSVALTDEMSGPGTALAQFTVRFVGQLIVGGSRSTTTTNWVQLLELPHPSVAVHTTWLVPLGKTLGALLTTLTVPPLLSVPLAAPSTTLLALHWPTSVLVKTIAGQLITGAVVSVTVMVWLTGAETLPQLSVAVHVRVTWYVVPQSWLVTSLTLRTGVPPQLSLAVGAVKLGVAGLSTLPSAPCPLNVGAVVSLTVMVWLRAALLPQASAT